MSSLDWDKLRIFHAVAEAGSLTKAGEGLNLSQSAVSRQISALEEDLGTPLFHRHARGLILTEQGEILFRTAHEIYGRVARAEGLLKVDKDKPHGDLRITAPVGFGSTWLTPRMREFTDVYPDINVEIILSDTDLDLGMREADVAIRLSRATQGDLVQRPLFKGGYHIFASPDYLSDHGTPRSVEDLDDHNIILYGDRTPLPAMQMNWLGTLGRNGKSARRPVLRVNNLYGVLQAVESGLGIGALPDYLVYDNNRVVKILQDVDGPNLEMYFIYPEELRRSKRVACFRDFLLQKVKEWQF